MIRRDSNDNVDSCRDSVIVNNTLPFQDYCIANTTFNMIVGLIRPNSGKILLDEQEITTLPVYKRSRLGVGYLAQKASVFRHLSVENNILSVLEMSNYSKEYQKERTEQMIEEFGLQRVRKKYWYFDHRP